MYAMNATASMRGGLWTGIGIGMGVVVVLVVVVAGCAMVEGHGPCPPWP